MPQRDFEISLSEDPVLPINQLLHFRAQVPFFHHAQSNQPKFYGIYQTLAYRSANGDVLIDYGNHGHIHIDFERRLARCHLPSESLESPWAVMCFFIKTPTHWALALGGKFVTHAGCVRLAGKTWLLVAETGSGKTTTTVALTECGGAFLGDDWVLLSKGDGAVLAHKFPCWIGFRRTSMKWFASLSPQCEPAIDGSEKIELNPISAWPDRVPDSTHVDGVLFPKISGQARSRLEKMGKTEALHLLATENVAMVTADLAEAHFDLLADLVDSVPCYQLHLGEDPMAVADTLRAQ